MYLLLDFYFYFHFHFVSFRFDLPKRIICVVFEPRSKNFISRAILFWRFTYGSKRRASMYIYHRVTEHNGNIRLTLLYCVCHAEVKARWLNDVRLTENSCNIHRCSANRIFANCLKCQQAYRAKIHTEEVHANRAVDLDCINVRCIDWKGK